MAQIFKVQPNKTLALNGKRFIARGVQMFDYLLCSFETTRTNYNYRSIFNPAWAYPNSTVSEPTYYARQQYIDSAYAKSQILNAYNMGANLIRISIEPAIRYATSIYVDPVNGLMYPPDMDMLDVIISHAESYGMAVQLQNSNDSGSVGENTTFLAWLADRYKGNWNVWINPANELNGVNNGGANVNNATLWQSAMSSYVGAIRGAGFTNPICLDPCGWAERLDLINTFLTSTPVFKDDQNLIIQPHYYPAAGETDFRTDKLPTANGYWVNYINQHCILVGEVGIDNLSGRLDPNLDAGVPSSNLTNWANAQASCIDFLKWANEQTFTSSFSGVIGHMWQASSRVTSLNDDNAMYKQDGTRTTWGSIYRNQYLSPAIINPSYALQGAKIGNPAIGTPDFQAEGKAGVKAAGVFITPNASSPILSFMRRDNGAQIGLISGNGAGIVYGTTSDYRLKTNISALSESELLSYINWLNPVMATWAESGVREPVLIAHEVAAVMPNAVTGEKDGAEYQTVDYAKLVPILIAAIQYLMKGR